MPALSVSQAIRDLVAILEENGGSLGNRAARLRLSERTGVEISVEFYERIKDHLIAKGLAARGKGQGGSLRLLSDLKSPEDLRATSPADSAGPVVASAPQRERPGAARRNPIDHLGDAYESLERVPGLYVKKNRVSLALFFGDDEDKLFLFWDKVRTVFVIQYRREKGKANMIDVVENIFRSVAADPGLVATTKNSVSIQGGQTVVEVNHLCRSLRRYLDEITLDPDRDRGSKLPYDDTYYREVAMLTKFYVENDLKWPRKAWRRILCLDDVDRLTVIGESDDARQDPWREHVVPASFIRTEAEKLAREGAPVSVISDFIKHHLYVVLINKRDKDRLDTPVEKGGKGLKECMPLDWIPGDDPLERLSAAKIAIVMPRPLPQWKPWRRRFRDRLKDFAFGRESYRVSVKK